VLDHPLESWAGTDHLLEIVFLLDRLLQVENMRFERFGALLLSGQLLRASLQLVEQVLEFSLKAVGPVVLQERAPLFAEPGGRAPFDQASRTPLADAIRFKGADLTAENGGRVPARVTSQGPADG